MGVQQAQPTPGDDLHPDRLLSDIETADRYGFTVSWLRKCRVVGGGIPYLKIGASVRYRPRNIEAYLESCVQNSTSDTGETAA